MYRDSIAERLAEKQKAISVAEFFEQNKQILGFDNLSKAMLTAVKEAVDNSLDACEEASILPDISVEIDRVGKDTYKITVTDNGPGIVKRQIANVFGRLLYGSRFYSIRQSRGQQGIGISAVVMYAQLSTGKPTRIISKAKGDDVAHEVELIIDTKKNLPEILREDVCIWDGVESGTKVECTIKARYARGKQSPYEYLKSTAIVNPHARIVLQEPDGVKTIFERATMKMPSPTVEIKPHPLGTELGTLLKMCKLSESHRLSAFLVNDFSRISYRVAHEICDHALLDEDMRPQDIDIEQAKRIIEGFNSAKIMAPQTDCLSPIGEMLIRKGLKNVLGNLKPDFYAPPVTRPPAVHSGNPFIVEAGIVYGGELPPNEEIQILRFANRVPLLYMQGSCVITEAVQAIDWRRYGLQQHGNSIPIGPAVVLVHVASTKIPFTSESKEAIAAVPELKSEIEKALRDCARKLHTHLSKQVRRTKAREKFEIVQKVLPAIAVKSASIVKKPVPPIEPIVTKIMDIVWIDDKVEYIDGKHRVTIDVYNYTSKTRKFNLYAVVPKNTLVEKSINPKPALVKEGYKIEWKLKDIKPVSNVKVCFELEGLDKDEYDENELYASGIDPVKIVGVQPLPGDWDLEGLPIISDELLSLELEEAVEKTVEESKEESEGELEGGKYGG